MAKVHMAIVDRLYEQQIRSLSAADRLQLVSRIIEDLIADEPRAKRRITELRGLGKRIWQGVDAQQYVNDLRDEWEQRA
ncbi:MAG: hypothetical protein NZ528_15675 [Caldilineales bacterium]|nr:hypothetical protein [Caldilineales bacterium]MDW8316383.1 hypothetical protein [Anaerolineae bacterium]